MSQAETRVTDPIQAEIRINKNAAGQPVIEGHAAVFNSESRPMVTKSGRRFVERILPGAFKRVLASSDQETKAVIDHDKTKVLARRSKSTLQMREDGKGLAVEIAVPDTTLGKDTTENVRAGNLDRMSFAFTTGEGDDEWTRKSDGVFLRTIKNVAALLDVTLTDDKAAYPATDLYLRMADEAMEKVPVTTSAEAALEAERKRDTEQRASMTVEDSSLISSCRVAMYYFRQAFDYANNVLDTCSRVEGDLNDADQRAMDDCYGSVTDLLPKLRDVKAALDAMGAEDEDDDTTEPGDGQSRELKTLRAVSPAQQKEMLKRIVAKKAAKKKAAADASAKESEKKK